MNCPHCQSTKLHKNGKERNGRQKFKCTVCDRGFTDPTSDTNITRNKVGISLNEFRSKYDVDFIVKKTLENLDPNMIYEKNDIIKLTGLRAGYPGLSATIEDQKRYYGKIGSTLYFSHPKTIEDLINQAKLN